MKRTLMVWILVLVMLIQLLPVAAFAETENPETEAAVTEPVAAESEAAEAAKETTEEVHIQSIAESNPLYPELANKAPTVGNKGQVEEEAITAEAESFAEASVEIRNAMEKRKGSITVYLYGYSSLSVDQYKKIWNDAFIHTGVPTQGDYLKWHWTQYSAEWNSYWSGSRYYTIIWIDVDYYTTASQETTVTNRVNQIINSFGFTAYTSDYEKARTIYEWVTANIFYDYDGLDAYSMAHSAYNGIVYGTCVCQGYASIIYRMYLQVGIPVRTIGGDAFDQYPYIDPNEFDDNHCWNIAKIGDKWYNLDATWDAGYAPVYWDWFLKCPRNFPDHSRWSEYDTWSFHNQHPMATSDYKPSYNGLVEVNGVWGYYVDGVLQTDFTDLVYYNDTWFYVENGIIDWGYTGLVPYNGNYFYVQNNVLDWAYTGLGYHNGGWYFIQNALLNLDYVGLVYFNGTWFYVENGYLTWDYTGMVYYEGNYFYVQNNVLDWSYTGLGYHNGGWYYIENALLKADYYGLVNFNGTWFYIEAGQLTWNTNGLQLHNGDLFYIVNSVVDWTYNGSAVYNGRRYIVKNGFVDL